MEISQHGVCKIRRLESPGLMILKTVSCEETDDQHMRIQRRLKTCLIMSEAALHVATIYIYDDNPKQAAGGAFGDATS